MKNINAKLKWCVISNCVLLIIISTSMFIFGEKTLYWNIGPNEHLEIVSIKINTKKKYYILLGVIAILKISENIIGEIAHPIIGFNIYNPDKKIITHFTKNELQLYGNIMYFVDSIKSLCLVIISISQIDIAFWSIFVREITSIFMIRYLLNEKKFSKINEKSNQNKTYSQINII